MKKLLIILTLGLMFGQTKMETRYYEIQLTSWEEDFSLYDITGESIDFAMINILGLKKNIISSILLIYNLFLMSLMSILGILLTNLTIFSNIKYDLFEFIYSALPFKLSYVSFANSEALLLIFIVNIITAISTVIPIYIIGKSKYVKF